MPVLGSRGVEVITYLGWESVEGRLENISGEHLARNEVEGTCARQDAWRRREADLHSEGHLPHT